MLYDESELIPIRSAEYITSGVSLDTSPMDEIPEFMLAGRSNVGKSSFINMVLNRKNLARTSAKPGKTQTLNYFLINDNFYFVDVPGYGYASVSQAKKKAFGAMLEDYLKNRIHLQCVFLLFDSRIGPTEDDISMYHYVRSFARDVIIVCTKMDKCNQHDRAMLQKSLSEKGILSDAHKIIYTSSVSKRGLVDVHRVLKSYLEECKADTIETKEEQD